MEDYLIRITDYLLTQSWQIAILVAATAAVARALRNKSAHVRYLLWLIVLTKCLMPPLFAVPLPVLPPDEPASTAGVLPIHIPSSDFMAAYEAVAELPPLVVESIVAAPGIPAAVERPPATVVREGLKIRQWLGVIWSLGLAVLLLAAVIKALRTESQLRRQRKPLAAELRACIESDFTALGFRPFPKIWLVEGRTQPFVWGLLRGSIYLPVDFIGPTRTEYHRDVLGHELSHVARFDAVVNVFQVIAQMIFWFHPLVWWANGRIRDEREKCCDEMVIARLGAEARDYSSAIVEILVSEHRQNRPVPSLAVAGSLRNVEERIETMMRPGKKFYERPSLVAAAVVLLLALLTAPTAFVLTARAQTQAALQYEEAPASEEFTEPAEREIDERRESQERVREEEEVEVRRSRRREEPARDELRRHRETLGHRAGQIERKLEGLRDDEDERARDLQAELREIRQTMRSIEREFADREPERRGVVSRERRDVKVRELMAKRHRLEEQARQVEHELAELLREGEEEEAERRRDALEEIHEGIRQIDEELGEAGRRREPGDRGRSESKEPRANLMRERHELEERARDIGRQLEELGERDEAHELRGEMAQIERRIHEIDQQLRGRQREPDRRQEARLEGLRRDIEHLIKLGRHDEAAQLERELHEFMRRRDGRPEADYDLRNQVRQLRGEVSELRNEMRELRSLLERLLEREPRARREREF